MMTNEITYDDLKQAMKHIKPQIWQLDKETVEKLQSLMRSSNVK